MPTYRIQGPDGKVYRVQADSEQQAVSGLKATVGAQQRRPASTFNDQVTRSASLGLSDMANAGMSALVSQAPRLMGKDPGYGLGDAYRAAKTVENDRAAEYGKANPGADLGAGLLGGLVMPGGKQLAKAATPVAKGLLGGLEAMARGGGIGAALGGIYGATTAKPDETIEGAKRGAVAGGLTGAALPAVAGAASGAKDMATGVARTVARAGNKAAGGNVLSPTREAGKRLVEALKKDSFTPEQIKTVQNQWLKNGVTPSLLDVVGRDSNTGALLRGAAMSGGGRKAAAAYNDRVVGNLQDEALNLTRRLTPNETRTADQVRQALTAERSATADAMYPAFQGEQIPAESIGSALQGRSGQVALARARNIADTMRDTNAVAEIDALLSGQANQVSAGTADLIRRGLRDAGVAASQRAENTMASGLQGRAGDIEQALMGVPGFDAARNAFRGTSQAIDAIDLGSTGLNAAPEAFASQFGALPEQAMQPGQVGYREAIETAIGRPTEGATGILNRLATSNNQGRNLGAAFGEEPAQTYQAGLGNLIDQVQNARFINPGSNSQTAGRSVDAALVDQQPVPKSIMGVVGAILDKVRMGATLTDAEREAIIQLGTSNQLPPEVGELLLRQPRNLQLGSRLSPAAAIAVQNQTGG